MLYTQTSLIYVAKDTERVKVDAKQVGSLLLKLNEQILIALNKIETNYVVAMKVIGFM